jgi:hypothetical protein
MRRLPGGGWPLAWASVRECSSSRSPQARLSDAAEPIQIRADEVQRSSGDALDDLDHLVHSVALATGEVHELSGSLNHGSPLGCSRH